MIRRAPGVKALAGVKLDEAIKVFGPLRPAPDSKPDDDDDDDDDDSDATVLNEREMRRTSTEALLDNPGRRTYSVTPRR